MGLRQHVFERADDTTQPTTIYLDIYTAAPSDDAQRAVARYEAS